QVPHAAPVVLTWPAGVPRTQHADPPAAPRQAGRDLLDVPFGPAALGVGRVTPVDDQQRSVTHGRRPPHRNDSRARYQAVTMSARTRGIRYGRPVLVGTPWKAGTGRALRLFRPFGVEQTDPDRFYLTLAQDSVGQVSRYADLAGAAVLDVGGGPGYFADAFRAAGATYWAGASELGGGGGG